jgi:hypothetical protein
MLPRPAGALLRSAGSPSADGPNSPLADSAHERQSAFVTDGKHQLILGNVLDALDDLFDRRERAALNLWRLLVASGPALGGEWEAAMAATAADLRGTLRGGLTDDQSNRLALVATEDLRLCVARVLG